VIASEWFPYKLSVGLLTNKGATFSIIGKGNVKIITDINGIRRKVKFENVLYTPDMRSNLISVREPLRGDHP